MIGQKLVIKQPFRVNQLGNFNWVAHMLFLAFTVVALSGSMSFMVRHFGYTELYQKNFQNDLDQQLQLQLFGLKKNSKTLEKTLLVGNSGFMGNMLGEIMSKQCANKFDILNIPHMSIRDIKVRISENDLVSYHHLKYKNVVFQNHIGFWTSLSYQPRILKSDLWGQSLLRDDYFLNIKDIKLFFDYSKLLILRLVGVENSIKFKPFETNNPVYLFQPEKVNSIIKKNKTATLHFVFDKDNPSYMTSNAFIKFSSFFSMLESKNKVTNIHSEPDMLALIGCGNAK